MKALLDDREVVRYLIGRNVLPLGCTPTVSRLSGGVSSIVFSVCWRERRLVVKQALPRLLVKEEWHADPSRALVEGAALKLATQLAPGSTPEIVDVDQGRFIIIMTHAPDGWTNWKDELLAGSVDLSVSQRLGDFLGLWHSRTMDINVGSPFSDREGFTALRVEPFYRTIAARHPELASEICRVVDRMDSMRSCLVHGDFSPKNVLVGEDRSWVLDFEVTHLGDPTFDVAFLLHHLLLKSVRQPQAAGALLSAATAFCGSYSRATNGRHLGLADISYLFQHVGCLALARIDGKSPVDYLNPGATVSARALAQQLILRPPDTLTEAWSRLNQSNYSSSAPNVIEPV